MFQKIKQLIVIVSLSSTLIVGLTPALATAQTPISSSSDKQCTSATLKADDNCQILKYLVQAINVLSAVVGIVVVIMIALGGLQYSASRDNPQATAAAKAKIQNALIGLVAYLFIYAFLQYIIPGGAL